MDFGRRCRSKPGLPLGGQVIAGIGSLLIDEAKFQRHIDGPDHIVVRVSRSRISTLVGVKLLATRVRHPLLATLIRENSFGQDGSNCSVTVPFTTGDNDLTYYVSINVPAE